MTSKKLVKREDLFKEEFEKRCHGKYIYRTQGYAKYKCALSNKFEQHDNKIEWYKCPFGKHYHLGHHPKVHVDRETLRMLMA